MPCKDPGTKQFLILLVLIVRINIVLKKMLCMKSSGRVLRKLLIAGILWLLTLISGYSQDAREIVRRMEEQMRGESLYSELIMETIRPRYTREIAMKSWSLNEEYALIYITAPARDEGTAYLKRGDEIWNYVPAIDRTVKMPPSMMSQAWMGSDFSNDDLVRGISNVDDYRHTLLRQEQVDGHQSYVIEMIPKPEAPVIYDKVIQWVTVEHYLPVRTENYDEFGDLVSTIHFREIQEMDGRMIPSVVEMVPENKSGHRTILTTVKADYNIDLSPSFFSLQNLTSIR